ncbi:MAG: hypothetical protein ICV60_15960 [Pyrinomonadaceae bacterium]|nr:hypothetical protein [Pyrinomonadaceae bacterium]
MSQRLAKNRSRKTSSRNRNLLWIGGIALIVFLLIYFEQTAILYVLATLGVTALLLVVAFADLKGVPNADELPKPADDAAAIGTGISSTLSPQAAGTTTTARQSRPGKRK